MPRLSPSQTGDALLSKWHADLGDLVGSYELICDVKTAHLLEAGSEQDETELEIEVQQPGVVARRFANPGDRVPVGQLLAVFADDKSEVSSAESFADSLMHLPVAERTLTNALRKASDFDSGKVEVCLWQGYQKGPRDPNSCGTCG